VGRGVVLTVMAVYKGTKRYTRVPQWGGGAVLTVMERGVVAIVMRP
jgi:hypothetical protein